MKLVFLQSPDNTPREVVLRDGQNIAGRDPTNEIHLPSRRVSRKHCTFAVQNGQVLVRDLGSSNGVIVEGQRITEAPLISGQRIQIGDYLLQYQQENTATIDELTLDPEPMQAHDEPPPFGGSSPFGAPVEPQSSTPTFGDLPEANTYADQAPPSFLEAPQSMPPHQAEPDSPFGALPTSEDIEESPFGDLGAPNSPHDSSAFGSGGFGNPSGGSSGDFGAPPPAAPQTPTAHASAQPQADSSSEEKSKAQRIFQEILSSLSRIPWSSRLGGLLLSCLLLVMLAPGGGILSLLSKAEATMERMSASHAIELARVTARINEPLISQPDTFDLNKGNISALDRVPGVSPGGARLVDVRGTIKIPPDQVGTQIEGINSLINRALASRTTEYTQDGGTLHILSPIRYDSETSGPAQVVGGVYVEYEISEFVNDAGRPTSLSLVAFVVIGLIFILIFITTWRMTNRPLRHTQEETELAMKGSLPNVSTVGNWPEMEDMVRSINRVLRRAGPGGAALDGQLATLVDMAPWPIILTDGNLRVTHANAVSSIILANDPSANVGQPLSRLVADPAISTKMKSLFGGLGGQKGKQGSDSIVIDGRERTLSIRVETSPATGAVEYAVVLIT